MMTRISSASMAASSGSWVTSTVDSPAAPPKPAHLLHQLVADRGVEGREGLVEEHHLRVVTQCSGQADPLTLSARKLGRQAIQKLFQVERF